MHNLSLNDELTMIQDTVRKLVQDLVAPQALEHDEHRDFVRPSFDALAEVGLFGAAVGEEQGGAGLGLLSLVVALEELGKACGSSARMFLTQAGIAARALDGIDAAAATLAAVLGGETIAAYLGPEHGLVARGDGAGFVLEGRAECVTGAGVAGVLVCAARLAGEAALFVVDPDKATIEAVPALGFRAAAPARVGLAAAAVPAEACLARGAEAEAAFGRAELAAAIGGAAMAAGSAMASVEHGRRHTEERFAFGKPLARQQAVSHKLVEGLRRAEAGRQLAFQAARLADAGEDAADLAAIARLTAVDAALFAADESIQVHGGYGYTVEYHVERHYRDAKTLEVLDGGALAVRDGLVARLAARA
jgi:alkylation response protein AidB-like acyl-CoA dehydrogenase